MFLPKGVIHACKVRGMIPREVFRHLFIADVSKVGSGRTAALHRLVGD